MNPLAAGLLGAILGSMCLVAWLPGCQGGGAAGFQIGTPSAAPSAPPPPPAPKDTDGDGIVDADDKCADKKEDGLPPEAKDGCPSTDADQDGVVGDADKCPDKPETKNGFQDDDGCPDEVPAVQVTDGKITIKEQVKFVTGKADIDHASDKLIEDIAKVFKDNPDIEFVEVAGHADKRGSEVANKQLTQKRAEAVMKELIKDGVGKERLRAVGYSSFCAIDEGDSDEALAKNRRVEFIILRRGGKELDQKWGGCDNAAKKNMKPQPLPAVKAAPAAKK